MFTCFRRGRIFSLELSLGLYNYPRLAIFSALNPFPKQALVFTCVQYKSFENTVGKGEIDRNE